MNVATVHESYRLAFGRVVEKIRGVEPAALQGLRHAAMQRFLTVGFPTRHDEAWRHTDISAISETPFEPAKELARPPAAAALEYLLVPGALLAVVVDGRFQPAVSRLDELPAGVNVGSLADAIRTKPGLILPNLGCLVGAGGHAFSSLNAALFRDGVFVHLPRGVLLERPIQLLFLGSGGARPTASFPRVLVVADEAAEATLIETHASLGGGAQLSCPIVEIVASQATRLDHYVLQRESEAALHVADHELRLDRDASVTSHAFTFGGGLVRNDVHAQLAGEGASLVLNGLYYGGGSQHVDTHMLVEHVAPRCESHELYKGVLDGKASAVFNGLIHVHPGAQKTNAKQSNRNLLLSREALANSIPQLRIFADDVKCTHGSTIGQLDDDAVFYLRSRGLGRDEARALLTWAFAGELIQRVKPAALRAQLEALLAARLPVVDEIRGAA